MQLKGTVERDPAIFWDERGVGLLKLVEHEKLIRIKELQKFPLPKGLKKGDEFTAEVEEGDQYYSFKAMAGSGPPRGSASQPPLPKQPPKTSDFNIPYSVKRVGQLYPILVDREGNVIDGKHRLAIDPNWRKEILPWVESRKDLLMARIHANLHRRTVPVEERRTEFTEYADILHADGTAIGELASTLAELTGFGEEYVRQLLPPSLKLKMRSELGKKGKLAQFQLGKTQPETLPDSKVPLTEEGFARTVREAPSGSLDLSSWSCVKCGANYRIDWSKMKIEFC